MYMKIVLLPLDFKNLDEEGPHYKDVFEDADLSNFNIILSERAIRVIHESDDEVLGVTDMSFYVIFKSKRCYYSRSTLFSLITSEHGSKSVIVSKLVEAMRSVKPSEKPYLALALLSETAPKHLFTRSDMSLETLVKTLIEHGKELDGIIPVSCVKHDFSSEEIEIIRLIHARFCSAISMLGEECRFGVTDGTEPHICIITGSDGFSFTLKRAVLTAIE